MPQKCERQIARAYRTTSSCYAEHDWQENQHARTRIGERHSSGPEWKSGDEGANRCTRDKCAGGQGISTATLAGEPPRGSRAEREKNCREGEAGKDGGRFLPVLTKHNQGQRTRQGQREAGENQTSQSNRFKSLKKGAAIALRLILNPGERGQ